MSFFDSRYDRLHSEHEQRRRQKSALDLEMEFIDYGNETGIIKDYVVSLDFCTCTDFRRRHKPCKHMYCLAVELGVFEIDDDKINESESIDNSVGIVRYPVSYVYSMYRAPPENFVVIDFETANPQPDSICQIGIVVVKNNSIAEKASFLVRPPDDNFRNSKIHGITLKDVENAPDFGQLWSEISHYFSGRTIAAYNLSFDLGCLLAVLEKYGIARPDFETFDVLANVRHYSRYGGDAKIRDLNSFKLANVARTFGFEHNAHEALSDATVTAEIQIYCSARFPEEKIAIHFIDVSAICDSIAKSHTPLENVVEYARDLSKSEQRFNYDEYRSCLRLMEQIAASHDSAPLYKYCGMIYEKIGKLDRALFLYKKSMSLDSEMKLKTRIQKLEREQRKYT